MEPTDNQIEEWRATSRANYSHVAHIPSCADSLSVLDKIFDMALAHNAAKRQEPAAERISFHTAIDWWWTNGSDHLPIGTKLYAAPPDLAAKLAEARELLAALHEETYRHSTGSLSDKVDDFLARTKP